MGGKNYKRHSNNNSGNKNKKESKEKKLKEGTNKGNRNNNNIQHDDSNKKIPWYLSQKFMIIVLLIGIFTINVYDDIKKDPYNWFRVSILSLFGSSEQINKLKNNNNNDPMSQCGLVMANSSLPGDSGWGMFVLETVSNGRPVSLGDPIIQLPDIPSDQAQSIHHLLHNYLWSGDVTGGNNEGSVVYSFLPGVGSLANGHPTQWNIAPNAGGAKVSNAGVRRSSSAGAGAFTQYHDFSFFAYGKDIRAGEEILVNYGKGWLNKISHDALQAPQRPIHELRTTGMCLDHIRPGISSSLHNTAGRGAFSTRALPKGTVVAPLPLIPVEARKAMKMVKGRKQLLLNYCLGHVDSSLLLVPYATVVNHVNHGGKNESNVRMRWSQSSLHLGKDLLKQPILELMRSPYGLLLELVAIRDIAEGEEILVDYGDEWQDAWNKHAKKWKNDEKNYVYASEYNSQMEVLKTHQELVSDPYPSNIRTTCFYAYDPKIMGPPYTWRYVNREYKNLYPCHVLDYDQDDLMYTVLIQNQDTFIANQQKIPTNHVVEQVPRSSIVLSDVLRSSDQNLVSAFRHEIGIPDDIFPQAWRDL